MKIGVLGGMSPALLMAIKSADIMQDIEFIEVTQEQVNEDEVNISIIGGMAVAHFECKDFRTKAMCPTWKMHASGKSGSNKSDRKRDKKNRWR